MSWDMRSNMKAKPGSQGVLFRGGSDQMTDAKWPRGYTPGRLAIARAAADPHNMYSEGEHGKATTTGPQRRDLIDTIARSTVPAEHLQDVKFHPGQADLDYGQPKGSNFKTGGTYTRKGSKRGAKTYSQNEIAIRRGNETNEVPIHEIGHHVSHEREAHQGYDTPSQRGQEEAFADDYAQQHYRPSRKEPYYRGVGTYNQGRRDTTRNDEFYAAYHAHRQMPGEKTGLERLDERVQAEDEHLRRNPPLPGLERLGQNLSRYR